MTGGEHEAKVNAFKNKGEYRKIREMFEGQMQNSKYATYSGSVEGEKRKNKLKS